MSRDDASAGDPDRTPSFTQTRARREMSESAFNRFIGGSPVTVFARLVFASLVVGALLVWLDIRPYEVFMAIQRMFHRLWMLGWDAVREVIQYVLAGAAIVLPIWLVIRLMNLRAPR